MKNILISLVLMMSSGFAGVTTEPKRLEFRLNQTIHLTDLNGLALPQAVAGVKLGDLIQINKVDKSSLTGQVTEIEETDSSLKVTGNIHNEKDTVFSFRLIKGGVFVGAIVDRENKKVFTLEFSPEYNGYVFVYSFLHSKQLI